MASLDRSTGGSAIRALLLTVAGYCTCALISPAYAGTAFGIYDARTLAMGGASVASANNDNAQFYNAALLAFNEEIEEKTQDSRFLFPLIIPQVAESAITIEDLAQDDPIGAMARAVRDFNATSDAMAAQAVVDIASNLDAALADIDGEDLFADVYFGLGISEPGKFQGAGFFMGTRLLAGGQPTVTTADRELLAAYQEGLTYVASDGTQGTEHPELFDANGALIDPGNSFDSTASAAGAIVTEAGVAMSRQLQLFGTALAAGFSFKVQRIDTFEDANRIGDDRIDPQSNSDYDGAVNFDFGLVKTIGEHWRLGLAVKDIIPHNYDTSLGSVVRLRPRARFGAAYQAGSLQIAADIDLTQNEPLGLERPTQELAVGAEWAFSSPVKVRAGFRYDIQGNRDSVVSLGVGTLWRRLAVDVAYAGSRDARAAALQFGVAF
jgi:hypothetical protein